MAVPTPTVNREFARVLPGIPKQATFPTVRVVFIMGNPQAKARPPTAVPAPNPSRTKGYRSPLSMGGGPKYPQVEKPAQVSSKGLKLYINGYILLIN